MSTRCSWLRMPSDTHTDRHCWGHSGAAPIWACLGWAGGQSLHRGALGRVAQDGRVGLGVWNGGTFIAQCVWGPGTPPSRSPTTGDPRPENPPSPGAGPRSLPVRRTPCILLQDDMEGSGNVFWSTARGADGLQVSAGAGLGQLGDGTSWGQGVPGTGLWWAPGAAL